MLEKLVTNVTIAQVHSMLQLKMVLFCFRFKTDENGNLLSSAFSIVMNVNSRYVDDLRILASIKLYLRSSFVIVINTDSGVSNNVDTLLALSISHFPLNSCKTKLELLKEVAFTNIDYL